MATNKKYFKSTIAIDEGAQNLITEMLKNYKYYEDLPNELRERISEYSFDRLTHSLKSNNPIRPRFSKLFVLVDYINAFVSGSLGSEYAKNIEDSVLEDLKEAIEDPETAVIILIDRHLNDEGYLASREGKHLPVLHANTDEECKLYGKVGEYLDKDFYDECKEEYVSSDPAGVWIYNKSTFGYPNMTEDVDGGSCKSRAIDKILELCGDEDLEEASHYMDDDYNWNHVYEVATNLANTTFVPDEIRLAGVATNICVLSNAILLQNEFPQSEIFIRESSVASYDPDLHKKAIDIMKGLGINID